MSTRERLIKARLGMPGLAEELQNISLACKRAGISRSHFYEIKEAFEKFGPEGLAPRDRRRPRMPSQTRPELEQKILEMTELYPTYSYLRISQQLRLAGIGVSPSAVRCVWQRQGLTLRYQRLLWLEQKTAARGGETTARTSEAVPMRSEPVPLCRGLTFRVFARPVLSLLLPPHRGSGAALLFRASAKDGRRRRLFRRWPSRKPLRLPWRAC